MASIERGCKTRSSLINRRAKWEALVTASDGLPRASQIASPGDLFRANQGKSLPAGKAKRARAVRWATPVGRTALAEAQAIRSH
jgi:hypothetical protein